MSYKKDIWDYFDESISPANEIHDPIPYNVLWTNVSNTFLNGFVNYAKPVSIFQLDRYTAENDIVLENGLTKSELRSLILLTEYDRFFNTDFRCFKDDIIILSKFESDINDLQNRFILFWYDMDVSDCVIGKFKTADSESDVIDALRRTLSFVMEGNENKEVVRGFDNGVVNYHELPLSFFKGWVKF